MTAPDKCEAHVEICDLLKDHDGRIRRLEICEEVNRERNVSIDRRLTNIELGIAGLNKRINGGLCVALAILAGFLIWYIQTL